MAQVKKICKAILLLLFVSRIEPTTLDFRVAGFIPSSSLFREIYKTVNPSYQIELSHSAKDCFEVWSNISYTSASGKSVPFGIKCRLNLIPVSVGLKCVHYLTNCWDAYIGAGPSFTWLKEKNTQCLSNQGHGIGGIFKLGATKSYKRARFLLFSEYQIQHVKIKNPIQSKKINVSGFLFGGAIGVYF